MKHGVSMFCTAGGLPPGELGALAEQLGFESIWLTEHTHIPAAHTPEYPDFPGGGALPNYYSRTLDPFVALTAAACATRTIKLAFGVCLIVQRSPITTAKAIASLDHLSGGRVILGVGAGWNREEMRNHGTDPRTRMALMAERVKAMKAIWTSEEEAEFHGAHVDFGPLWMEPKPLQRPHPPVLVAGMGPTVLDRVVDFGDGWMPEPSEGLLERVTELQARAQAAGRGELPVTVVTADLDEISAYEAVGVTRCVHEVAPDDAAAARGQLVDLARRLELRPQL